MLDKKYPAVWRSKGYARMNCDGRHNIPTGIHSYLEVDGLDVEQHWLEQHPPMAKVKK